MLRHNFIKAQPIDKKLNVIIADSLQLKYAGWIIKICVLVFS
jgi:hypothetical protein